MGPEEVRALRVDLEEHMSAVDEAFAVLERCDACEGLAGALAVSLSVIDLRVSG
jgi:hypothetical protein